MGKTRLVFLVVGIILVISLFGSFQPEVLAQKPTPIPTPPVELIIENARPIPKDINIVMGQFLSDSISQDTYAELEANPQWFACTFYNQTLLTKTLLYFLLFEWMEDGVRKQASLGPWAITVLGESFMGIRSNWNSPPWWINPKGKTTVQLWWREDLPDAETQYLKVDFIRYEVLPIRIEVGPAMKIYKVNPLNEELPLNVRFLLFAERGAEIDAWSWFEEMVLEPNKESIEVRPWGFIATMIGSDEIRWIDPRGNLLLNYSAGDPWGEAVADTEVFGTRLVTFLPSVFKSN